MSLAIVLLSLTGLLCSAGQPGPRPGSIEGRVVYLGDIPRPTIVFEGGTTQHVLQVDERRGLRDAVAFLPDAPAEPSGDETPATLHQIGFVFQPPVLAVRQGQAVRFTNEDGANHSVRGRHTDPANRFDAYTGAGQAHTMRFRAGRDPVAITCDVHTWMAAWIYVFEHGKFAVTDDAGRFRIAPVPAGVHRLAIRHPAARLSRELRVRVDRGGTARVEAVFKSTDLPSPSANKD